MRFVPTQFSIWGVANEGLYQLVASQPLWAKLFYLVRTGHTQEALDEALTHHAALEHREPSFVTYFKTWIESPDAKFVCRLLLHSLL